MADVPPGEPPTPPPTVRLTPAQRAAIDAGHFIRVELDAPFAISRWVATTSALVGRAPGEHEIKAFANLCRHQAVPLDLVDEDDDDFPKPSPAPLSDDGASLICLRHGALYRITDGLCTSGPCAGQRLHGIAVAAIDDV